MAEERYVLRHELEQTKGNLHKKINQVDSKHDGKHSDLKLLLHTFIESQKPMEKTLISIDGRLESMNETLGKQGERLTAVEYGQVDHQKRLKGIEDSRESKKDQNTKIIVALITAIAGLGGSALGLAQFFF